MHKTKFPARPNLEHLRGQAKKLVGGTYSKLADAQLAVAREHGFASWAKLVKHVETLRGLEGEWRIDYLEVDGAATPARTLAHSRILIDGDRFRTESPEGTYEGIFSIASPDEAAQPGRGAASSAAAVSPPHFDIHFVAGPDAGSDALGIYKLEGDHTLVLCLGLVGGPRPRGFATKPGSGAALERLVRASTARPANVTGGTPPSADDVGVVRGTPAEFAFTPGPLLARLRGTWDAVELVADGRAMAAERLGHGKRTLTGNHLSVVFGGRKMIDALVRVDERASPVAIDYLHQTGKQKGTVTLGILDWDGEIVRFAMAAPGEPRPTSFAPPIKGTLSRWRPAARAT